MCTNCILNELSLHGQYASAEDFLATGANSLGSILNVMKKHGVHVLYKKSDVYGAPVASGIRLNEVLFLKENRINDNLRILKSALTSIQNQPYWDLDAKQDYNSVYLLVGKDAEDNADVTATGIAEAHARDAFLISLTPSNYCQTPLIVQKDSEEKKQIDNIWSHDQYLDFLFEAGNTNPEEYIKSKFSKRLDFSRIKRNAGFNLINKDNVGLFDSTFSIVERTPWHLLRMNDGLDFKEFSKNRNTKDFFTADEWSKRVMKFRVNGEIRCFGNVENDKFYVLRIDLDHKLSDLG